MNRDARLSMCSGKEPFLTFDRARAVAKRVRRRRSAMQPYKCPFCQHWHLGEITKFTKGKSRK